MTREDDMTVARLGGPFDAVTPFTVGLERSVRGPVLGIDL